MRAWDDGIVWHLEQSADEGPDWRADPLTPAFVLEQHLKSAHPEAEQSYIDHLIKVSLRDAERVSRRSLLPQTWRLVLSGFPWGAIELPRPPTQEILSISFSGSTGLETWPGGSPALFQVTTPSGPYATRARVWPLDGTSWPATSTEARAVVVAFRAGYQVDADGISTMPEDFTHARLLAIHEMHKQRSESVHIAQSTAIRTARSIYVGYRAYGY
jgi:hypothetical protein